MKTRRNQPLTKRLLFAFAEILGAFATVHRSSRSLTYATFVERGKAIQIARQEKECREALRNLQRTKLINIHKKGGQIHITLTDKAQRLLLKHQCATAPKCKANECILVVWDIPEAEKHLRNYFRIFLKERGFRRLQYSVWISDRDVYEPLKAFIKLSGAKPWVEVFRSSRP